MARDPSQEVQIGEEIEMVEGPYLEWCGTVMNFAEEPGWIIVLFDNGNEIEVPACMAARRVS